MLETRAKQKGLSLTSEIGALGDGDFRGDPTRLRQILLNLVTNAIKFTERGSVTIAVTAAAADDGGARLRIEVRDMGIGVSDEAKGRLFTPFEQADASIARRFGGTGLGLSISRKLVELMNGRISVADRPGGGASSGSRSRCLWPRPSTPTNAARRALAESGPVAPVSGRILLAEDNAVNIEVATLILEGAGYTVDVARDGLEAVAAVRRRDYDLVLMDVQMPKLDGLSATREIRAFEGEGERVPILAMTANAMAGDQRQCLEAGMDGYVSKPIAPAKLRDTVARLIAAAGLPASDTDSVDLIAIETLPVIEQDIIDTLRSCMPESKFSFLVEFYVTEADAQAQQFQQWRSSLTSRRDRRRSPQDHLVRGSFWRKTGSGTCPPVADGLSSGRRSVDARLVGPIDARCRSGLICTAPNACYLTGRTSWESHGLTAVMGGLVAVLHAVARVAIFRG